MSDTIDGAITELQGQLRALEEEADQVKATINLLCKRGGREPLYTDVARSGSVIGGIKGDTFYGQPLNSCIQDYLAFRKSAGLGPASVREIYDSLLAGGFQFNAKSKENAERSLRITLAKAYQTFHRLPNGTFGLLSWYPAVKPQKAAEEEEEDSEDGENKGATAVGANVAPPASPLVWPSTMPESSTVKPRRKIVEEGGGK